MRVGITLRDANTLELLELANGDVSAIQLEEDSVKIDVREGRNMGGKRVRMQFVVGYDLIADVLRRTKGLPIGRAFKAIINERE